jgi:hypothetical protein
MRFGFMVFTGYDGGPAAAIGFVSIVMMWARFAF